jgi:hypothetical protein
MIQNKEGWAYPLLSKKFHYFTLEGTSLCGKWFLLPTEVDNSDPTIKTKDSCAACYAKLMKLETRKPK